MSNLTNGFSPDVQRVLARLNHVAARDSSSDQPPSPYDLGNLKITQSLVGRLESGAVTPNLQVKCPLFAVLPPELRNKIFSMVVTERDGETAIPMKECYYRPDFKQYKWIDTALLRLTYSEYPGAAAALRQTAKDLARDPLSRILPCQTLHVFGQVRNLEEDNLRSLLKMERTHGLVIRHLIITIRHIGWWMWHSGADLHLLAGGCMQSLPFIGALERVTMNLETRNGKKGELDALLQDPIGAWVWRTEGGGELRLASKTPQVETWIGSDAVGTRGMSSDYVEEICGPYHTRDANGTPELEPGQMLFHVATMTWNRICYLAIQSRH